MLKIIQEGTMRTKHTQSITCIAWKDDTIFATCSADGSIKIWEIIEKKIKKYKKTLYSSKYVTSLDWSSNGNFLISGGLDKAITIWNVSTGKPIKTLKGHTGAIESIACSHDGKYIASSSNACDKTVKIWNTTTGKCEYSFEGTHCLTSVAWSPDNNYVASGSWNNRIIICDVKNAVSSNSNQKPKKTLGYIDFDSTVFSVAWSPDGKYLVSGHSNKLLKIWNPYTDECTKHEKVLKGHISGVCCVACSPNGKLIASYSFAKNIRIWNATTGECQKIFDDNYSHHCLKSSIAWSPNGQTLAEGYFEKVYLYSVQNYEEERETRVNKKIKNIIGMANSLISSIDH